MFKKAFTLIELSLVVIIIGILSTIMITSSRMLDNAKLHQIIKEVEEQKNAIDSFKLIYNSYPGDMIGYHIWGSDCATTQALCDGDADLTIEYEDESFMALRHLYLAELYRISYTGDTTQVKGESIIDSAYNKAAYIPFFTAGESNSSTVDQYNSFSGTIITILGNKDPDYVANNTPAAGLVGTYPLFPVNYVFPVLTTICKKI